MFPIGVWTASAPCALLLALCLFASAQFASGGDRISGSRFVTRSEVIAKHGMAATSQPLATQIALDILKKGGSAVDAAIAANAALGLMEPTGNGMGGDLFALVWDAKTGQLYGLNASGRSPYELSRAELLERVGEKRKIPSFGPLPVTVPGCVDGWAELHARFGRLPLNEVLAPAARYAREGFPLSEVIAHYWAAGKRLEKQPGFAAVFLPDGRAPRKGELFRNPALADTLEKVGSGGRDVFYRGELADRMDAFCRANGCFLRKRDFEAHSSTWVEPVSTSYRGYDLWELPPNGHGIAALQILNLIEAYDVRSMTHNSAAFLHLMIEAKKLAYEDRARYYADPDFVDVPITRLISKEYAAERRRLIDLDRAAATFPPGEINWSRRVGGGAAGGKRDALAEWSAGDAALREGDTIYLTVADEQRNLVSLIQSNYRGFGSGLCPDGLGFCFQDRGELFSLDEGHPNVYEPHKRPFHTIIPAFITRDGKPFMSFGVMGGDMQPQGHVQIVVNLVDFGMNVQEAGDAARWYHTGSSEPTDEPMTGGGSVALESGVAADAVEGLRARGHRLTPQPGAFGGYQAIMYDAKNDVYVGASEMRKDGQAAGY